VSPRRRIAIVTALGAVVACSVIDPLDGLSDNFGKVDAAADAPGVDAADAGGSDAPADNVVIDAPPDAPPPCDPGKDFGVPQPLDSINSTEQEGSARLTPDERTIYFDGIREAGAGTSSFDLFTASRGDGGDSFGPFARVAPPDDAGTQEYSGSVTDDLRTLFFERQPIGGANSDIYMATRAGTTGPFGAPVPVPGINTAAYEANPFVRGDGKELWYVATGPGNTIDIFLAKANGVGVYNSSLVSEVSLPTSADFNPVISADKKALYFASDRPLAGAAGLNIWVATRADPAGTFDPPVGVNNVNTNQDETPTWLSPDGCRLYISSDRAGGKGLQDIYVSSRPK
jgi:hypothetical protein